MVIDITRNGEKFWKQDQEQKGIIPERYHSDTRCIILDLMLVLILTAAEVAKLFLSPAVVQVNNHPDEVDSKVVTYYLVNKATHNY